MIPQEIRDDGRFRRWLPWSGVAAIVGLLVSIGMPWMQTAVLGTRPYVTSVFDLGSLAGWVLMLVGLGGVYATFNDQFGRLGRVSVGTTAVGMLLVAALLFRRVILLVNSGFLAVPATGEDPASLLLSTATVLGLGLTVIGTGGIGFALHWIENTPTITSWLLLLAPAVPLFLSVVNVLFDLPLSLGRLFVTTNVVLVPFSLGWLALGVTVWSRTQSPG